MRDRVTRGGTVMAKRDRANRIEGLLRTQLAQKVAIKEIPDDVIRSVAAEPVPGP
jgi:hypothetical protein